MTATPSKEVLSDKDMHKFAQIGMQQRVKEWCVDLMRVLDADFERQYGLTRLQQKGRFIMETGRKYHRIIFEKGVHAFVDKNTGQVYKPASWKGPAKHVRYDLRIIREREACYNNADWAGGYLYK